MSTFARNMIMLRNQYSDLRRFLASAIINNVKTALLLSLLTVIASARSIQAASAASTGLGIFTDQTDVGAPPRAGSAQYDSARGTYNIVGGGGNMWFTNDSFHYVWKRASGNLDLEAGIHWSGTNGNAHRKACLVIRQTLEPDSAYMDVAVHGNGLTSLQYREAKGAMTQEIQAGVSAPDDVRLEKRGEFISLRVAAAGGKLHPSGCVYAMKFDEPFYVGLGVCAHDTNALEQATFSGVQFNSTPALAETPTKVRSAIEVVPIASRDRRVVYETSDHIEAPNWSHDGRFFLFNNRNGHLYRLPVTGGEPEFVETGFAHKINNDHGISPDGTQLAISDQTENGKSMIYILPIGGGVPKQISKLAPSYWHGWSPDGRTLVFCGERDREFDVYSIPADGGDERRLTTATGLDDGPDFSPDGQFIYFNSERSGSMQIWRMKSDGTEQRPITSDEYNNWFAHPSPDGKWLVFLSYPRDVTGHPENKFVTLRLMPIGGGEIRNLAKLFGGQGTINVPSWSPDSRNVAFVSYEPAFE
jgi:TolB protein